MAISQSDIPKPSINQSIYLHFKAAFEMVVEPVVRAFAPDLIIVAAGFDAARVSEEIEALCL